jgi:PTH1 family peptidyl-tRNA hydrolase
MGVGHPGHKDKVPSYVLNDFSKADAQWLDDVLRGISDGASHLANDDPAKCLNKVALRVAPPRTSTSQPKPKTETATPQQEPEPQDTRSPLQKLMERFK